MTALTIETPWKPLEDRQHDRDARKHAVLRMAAKLFSERGFHRVTMKELAEHLNITKPALYNYFDSKSAILTECFRLGKAVVEADLLERESYGGSGLEKLRHFVRRYTCLGTTDYGACMFRLDDRELPDAERREVRGHKRTIDAKVRALIREGIADGSVLPMCDVRLTAFAILGALNWIAQWYRPDGEHTPEEIGDEFAARLVDGIASGKLKRPR